MEPTDQSNSGVSAWLRQTTSTNFSVYCIVAAFSTYFCMYAFRKPFTAGQFSDVTVAGVGYKTILIAAQVAGYTLSKFIGIKVISEMPAKRRALAIVVLIVIAELALLLFAMVPAPMNFPLLFLNGLPLGMVFGLVLSFLEGRRLTETLSAGLCASFIVASGVVKYVGRALIVEFGVSEYWMPFVTGLIFFGPLILGVLLLSQIPRPTEEDVSARSQRKAMTRLDRATFFRRHAFGLSGLVIIYVLLTIIRSIRDDFGVEIWNRLGYEDEPEVFATSEIAVMLGVVVINGSAVWIRSNRRALLGSLGLVLGGFLLVLFSLWSRQQGVLQPFAFMVLVGVGTYVPYVAFHTTVFERLIAAFHDRGNIGYLMYLADAAGYLGYVAVMVAKNFSPGDIDFLQLFLTTTMWISVSATIITLALVGHYFRKIPRQLSAELAPSTPSGTA